MSARSPSRGCVVFAWPEFEPGNLFAGLAAARLMAVEALADGGADVVMVYTGEPGDDGEARLRQWARSHPRANVAIEVPPVVFLTNHPWRLAWRRSYDFHQWLRGFANGRPVAVVDAPESSGALYFAALARGGGLDYAGVRFVVEASGPLRWRHAAAQRAPDSLRELYADFLERRSIELADALVVPSGALLEWIKAHNWPLPDQVEILAPATAAAVVAPATGRASRLVFVGALDSESRLPAVCEMLSEPGRDGRLGDVEIVFWGPDGTVGEGSGSKYLRSCAAEWKFRWRIEERLTPEAFASLFGDGAAVALFAGGEALTPVVRQWCEDAGVPCVSPADRAGGAARVRIDPADPRRVVAFPDPAGLREMLKGALDGAPAPAQPAPLPVARRIRDLSRLLVPGAVTAPAAEADGRRPLVSVCIVTRNRRRFLTQALASIEAQDYRPFEVVLIDDGSDRRGVLAMLDEIEPRFREKGWKLLRQERAFHAAARNRAAREAAGEFVMFFDDDCVAEPGLLSTLVRFAMSIGTDLVTCPRHVFRGDHAPGPGDRSGAVWTPLGAVPSAALLENCLGDTNLLIRREAFFRIGGLRVDFGVPAADREFLIRAVTHGLRLEVLPEVLYHYRVTEGSVSRNVSPENMQLKELRILRPFAEALPPALADVPSLAAGLARSCVRLQVDLKHAAARIHKLEIRIADMRRAGFRMRRRTPITPRTLFQWLLRLGHSIRKRLTPGPRKP